MAKAHFVDAVLDEPFPEEAVVIQKKKSIRTAASLLHEDVSSTQAWLEAMRDRHCDYCDRVD